MFDQLAESGNHACQLPKRAEIVSLEFIVQTKVIDRRSMAVATSISPGSFTNQFNYPSSSTLPFGSAVPRK